VAVGRATINGRETLIGWGSCVLQQRDTAHTHHSLRQAPTTASPTCVRSPLTPTRREGEPGGERWGRGGAAAQHGRVGELPRQAGLGGRHSHRAGECPASPLPAPPTLLRRSSQAVRLCSVAVHEPPSGNTDMRLYTSYDWGPGSIAEGVP
jgi:hypothetical protein